MKINSATVRNAMVDEIDDALGATSYARFQDANQTNTYAKCALNTPDPFGASSGGAISLVGTPQDTAPSKGTAVRLGFYTAKTGGTLIFTCGINTSGTSADVIMADNTIETTDTVQITSLTVTVPEGTPST